MIVVVCVTYNSNCNRDINFILCFTLHLHVTEMNNKVKSNEKLQKTTGSHGL